MASKFTRDRRVLILELLQSGTSRQAAAKAAGIDRLTLRRWLLRGAKHPDGQYGQFRRQVLEAEASRRLVVLKAEQDRWESDPLAAFEWLRKSGEFTSLPESVLEVLRDD